MAKITRRVFTGGVFAAGVAAPGIVRAQTYPAGQQIKFIVGFPAGGAQDIVGRIIADRLGALWGVSTVVENVSGAGGNIAMDRVAKGPSDGTQIMVIPPGFANNQFLYARMPFDPEKDLIPLGQIASIPNLLCVKKGAPFNSVKELIDFAKANPGKLNCASSGIGTTIHLSAELFKSMTGCNVQIVHYRGSAQLMNDMLSGTLDMVFDNIPSIIEHARTGGVKPLGISTLKRSSIAPEFPPVADTVPGYDTTSWIGVGVRAGTPKAICDKIEEGAKTICKDPVLKQRLALLVSESADSSAASFASYVTSERQKWGKLITDLKIKVE